MEITYHLIVIGILAIYAIILYRITGKNRNTDIMLWPFLTVAIAGAAAHFIMFCNYPDTFPSPVRNYILTLFFSIRYSLEMFVGDAIIFKGALSAFFDEYNNWFIIYTSLYGMAILTSGFAIFHFISRIFHNLFWLKRHKHLAKSDKSHIFIGINKASLILAEDLKGTTEHIIFIDIPNKQDSPQGLSIWNIIARIFRGINKHEELKDYTILRAGKGLSRLPLWLENEKNCVYILSDDQTSNIANLEALWEYKNFKCKIFCHVKKEGLVNRYDSITDIEDRVTFIDSSYLAVEYLKRVPEMLPVRYVDIAKASDGQTKLGYVESSFNCAVIGLGETGQEAVKFLYEYGAFPNRENKKAPFKCHIFDYDTDMATGKLGIDLKSLRSTTASRNEFELHNCKVGTIEFRTKMLDLIEDLNYIVICLGDDNLNLQTALDIAESAEIQGRGTAANFCIAVKQSQISKLNEDTLAKANNTYNNCLHPFGMLQTIWKQHIITNVGIEQKARYFFDSYTELSREILKAKGWDAPDWDARARSSRSNNYKERCKARRQIAQDYSNCLHINTKRLLCEHSSITPDMIYSINDNDQHCTKDYQDMLEHLAVCEHLRWEASHLMLGYSPTEGNTDDVKKLHQHLKPYSELDETTKHFDWLVVKNSLE